MKVDDNTYMTIKVDIGRTTKPYVGKIIGTSERYGFELKFLSITRKSAKYAVAEITEPGFYRLPDDSTIGNRGIRKGFAKVSEDGTVTEVTKDEVVA
jgi:hypothetical protein